MPETFLAALVYCKYKKYTIKPLLQIKEFYFVLGMEVLYAILQIGLFMGHYEIVKYAGTLKSVYLCAYLGLIFRYDLYIQALHGSLWMIIGGALNKLAIWANGGKMPVFPSLSYVTGYVKAEAFESAQVVAQDFHVLGNSATKLKILTDYFDLGYSILSIGDLMIRVFVFLIIYHSVRKINEKLEAN